MVFTLEGNTKRTVYQVAIGRRAQVCSQLTLARTDAREPVVGWSLLCGKRHDQELTLPGQCITESEQQLKQKPWRNTSPWLILRGSLT